MAFGVNPGYEVSSVQANGRDVPFSVGEYQEYNEAMLKAHIPADEDVELVVEYGGFPREDRNISVMQGGAEISDEYLLPGKCGPVAPPFKCAAGRGNVAHHD